MQTPYLFMLPEESTCVHIDLVLSVVSEKLYLLLCSVDRSSAESKICMRLRLSYLRFLRPLLLSYSLVLNVMSKGDLGLGETFWVLKGQKLGKNYQF